MLFNVLLSTPTSNINKVQYVTDRQTDIFTNLWHSIQPYRWWVLFLLMKFATSLLALLIVGLNLVQVQDLNNRLVFYWDSCCIHIFWKCFIEGCIILQSFLNPLVAILWKDCLKSVYWISTTPTKNSFNLIFPSFLK